MGMIRDKNRWAVASARLGAASLAQTTAAARTAPPSSSGIEKRKAAAAKA